MGRPLNKKYFGNRNVGTGGYELGANDDFIGGEGIASINWSNYGSWMSTAGGAAAPLAGLALPAPSIPGGVQATWTNYFGVAAVTTGAGSVGLVVGDTYEYTLIPGSVIRVATSSNNGTNATFTVTTPGSTTSLLTDTQTVSLTKLTGTGVGTFTVDVFSKVVNTVINEKGSGYTGAETFTVTLANGANGTVPAGTIVLTTDSGSRPGYGDLNANTNQENAILIYAKTTRGGSSKLGDIVKQTNARSYKVKTADGTAVVKLVAASPAVGQATITATDSSGKTYYVTKLTAHKALLVPYGTNGHEFPTTGTEADGSPIYQSVKWTFGSATAGQTVTVANA